MQIFFFTWNHRSLLNQPALHVATCEWTYIRSRASSADKSRGVKPPVKVTTRARVLLRAFTTECISQFYANSFSHPRAATHVRAWEGRVGSGPMARQIDERTMAKPGRHRRLYIAQTCLPSSPLFRRLDNTRRKTADRFCAAILASSSPSVRTNVSSTRVESCIKISRNVYNEDWSKLEFRRFELRL